jgi:hypothetical protein
MTSTRNAWLIESVARGKYAALYCRLQELAGSEWTVSFREIEAIIGFDLPRSARMYRPWWANSSDGGHSQALAWVLAGWQTTQVDLEGEMVRFFRRGSDEKHSDASANVPRKTPPTMEDFRSALVRQLSEARNSGAATASINAGKLHREVGGYPTPFNRMQMCCNAMYGEQRAGDRVLSAPPKKFGATLTIEYRLPRP